MSGWVDFPIHYDKILYLKGIILSLILSNMDLSLDKLAWAEIVPENYVLFYLSLSLSACLG